MLGLADLLQGLEAHQNLIENDETASENDEKR